MVKKFVYMIGIEPQYWTKDDEKACKNFNINHCGYYKLGDNEGQILVGTLKNLLTLCKDYFGVDVVDEYLTEYEYFDFEDGEWINGHWCESKKDNIKPLKESQEDDIKKFVYDLINPLYKCVVESFYNEEDEFVLKIGLFEKDIFNKRNNVADVIFSKLDGNNHFIKMLDNLNVICKCIVYEVNKPSELPTP